jgi:NADPH2:quinone reductase
MQGCQTCTLPQRPETRATTAAAHGQRACLGIPALTAGTPVNVDGGVAGKIVFLAGGAGAVGHYAIQIADAHDLVEHSKAIGNVVVQIE